jgi:cell division initiation protein
VKVTPLDIRRKEFKRSVRGYSDEEVDLFLDEVADEFERLFQENVELQERIRRLEEQVAGNDQLRGALEKTLVLAQLQADETRVNARKESELILKDAELKARANVSDSYAEVQRVQQALIQLKHLEEDFRFKFRSLLEGHLKLLAEAPINLAGSEPMVIEAAASPTPGESPFVVPAGVEEVPEYPSVAHPVRSESPVAPETAASVLAAAVPTPPMPPAAQAPVPVEDRVETAPATPAEPRMVGAVPPVPDETTTGDTATVEQRSMFAEFDQADTDGDADAGEDSTMALPQDDPLSGFFFSGKPGRGDGGFGGSGDMGKPRDFEW